MSVNSGINSSVNAAEHNKAVSDQLGALMRRHKSIQRQVGPKAVGPGGKVVDATPYLRNLHLQEKHSSFMADVDQHPERYLKDPRPGYRYLWVSVKDEYAKSRIQSGRYIEILTSDLKAECDLAFVEGPLVKRAIKGTQASDKGVYHYDLQLCACSPESWDALFGIREALGMKKVTSGIEQFYAQMEAEGVEASFEMQEVQQ